jgi:hypothetical protein
MTESVARRAGNWLRNPERLDNMMNLVLGMYGVPAQVNFYDRDTGQWNRARDWIEPPKPVQAIRGLFGSPDPYGSNRSMDGPLQPWQQSGENLPDRPTNWTDRASNLFGQGESGRLFTGPQAQDAYSRDNLASLGGASGGGALSSLLGMFTGYGQFGNERGWNAAAAAGPPVALAGGNVGQGSGSNSGGNPFASLGPSAGGGGNWWENPNPIGTRIHRAA